MIMKGHKKEEKVDLVDSPLSLPVVDPVDHQHICVKYSAVLEQAAGQAVNVEDVDTLQGELEHLQGVAARRIRSFQHELELLDQWVDGQAPPIKQSKGKPPMLTESRSRSPNKNMKPESKSNHSKETSSLKIQLSLSGTNDHTVGETAVSLKRSPLVTTDEPSTKKIKDLSGKAKAVGKKAQIKGDNVPQASGKTPASSKKSKLKFDAPNRFWALVEPYCAEITQDQLQVLEGVIHSQDNDAEYYKIPALGKRFNAKWTKQDCQDEGLSSPSKALSSHFGGPFHTESSLGPFTQRLVQALLEESIINSNNSAVVTEADAAEAASVTPSSLARQLNLGNAAALERRIKKELEENGLLDHEHDKQPETDEGDEVLAELKRKQAELRVISAHNCSIAKRLLKNAKEEMSKQQLRQRMAVADADVLDAWQRMQNNQGKKAMSKKEVEACRRVLREREHIVKQLDTMQTSNQ